MIELLNENSSPQKYFRVEDKGVKLPAIMSKKTIKVQQNEEVYTNYDDRLLFNKFKQGKKVGNAQDQDIQADDIEK